MSEEGRYRFGAGIMLLNQERRVWVGQRIDNPGPAWQMPQGGVDEQEDSWAGALRELEEETGIARHLVSRVDGSPCIDVRYELPDELRAQLWKGRYVGQRQHWYLCTFKGRDADVRIDGEHAEFSRWKWEDPRLLPELIVPFKRGMYEAILGGFARWL
ncbi:RNA pyrophosphohydrolase [Sphingomicrobium flavum]|uniref:RNA pyrophosphohydrolase n=1 Tax=Sphingomicrobium flavum TaxID=1229164 RepID=UPI0021ADC4D3|nr:RNA pyrophosphohydrolase [Sphingomicrobium flavum]